MAATGKTPILLYGSTTPTNAPAAGNLTNSSDGCEIAINVADKNLFFKDSTNAVNTVPIRQSSASSNGWLSSTDWSTFNGKAPAFTYTTNYIPFGQGTTTPTESSLFTYTSGNLLLGTTTNSARLSIGVNSANADGIYALNANNSSYFSLYACGATGYGVTDWANSTLLEAVPASGGNLVLGSYSGSVVIQTGARAQSSRFFASGGVSIGNTTDPGAATLAVNTATWSGPPASPKIWTTGGVAVGDSSNWTQSYQYGVYFSTAFYVVNTTPTGVYINSGSTAWSAYSDARLKTVTGKYETPLADINQLEPVKFTWNWDESKKPAVGLLAQSVEKVVPEAIDHAKLQNTDDETEYMSVRYSELIPLLVASIQELQAKLKAAGVAGF